MIHTTLKKILFCASTPGHILHFHLPYLQSFHGLGYEIWVAVDRPAEIPFADHVVAFPFKKSLLSPYNIQAIVNARSLIKKQKFDVVSTHTTLASAVVRAAILTLPKKNRPLVFCTSHGYLFSESDGWKKWKYLLPEKLCASVTDVLMVMNHEDWEIAQWHHLYKNQLCYIDGMGLRLQNYHPTTPPLRIAARKAAGYTEEDFLFIYAAEFSARKNQALLIRAFASISCNYPTMKLLLAGNGALLSECKKLVKALKVEKQIRFLGYVDRMESLYPLCDVSVTCSRIEGLPFNVMESMACGLPVIASDIKGHRELVVPEKTGFLFPLDDQAALEQQLISAYQNREQFEEYQINAIQSIQQFRLDAVLPNILDIYKEAIKENII